MTKGKPSRGPITWSMPMLAKLRRMWSTGSHTMLEIAVAISPKGHPLSRSAVAGMIRRNGMTRDAKGPRKAEDEPPEVEQGCEFASAPSASSAPEASPTILLRQWRIKNRVRQVRALPANGEPVILLDLGVGCKWPVGQDKDGQHLFCNRQRGEDRPYCDEHHILATQGRGRPVAGQRPFSW